MSGGENRENAGISPPEHDVFISYATPDAAVADRVCSFLEGAGVSCWIAPRNVLPGSLYAESIIRAINGAKVLVLVLSEGSVSSSHVGKEIERASSKHRAIVTLRIDAVELTPALEYFLSESQWIDAAAASNVSGTNAGGIEPALPKLTAAVKRLLAGGANAPPARESSSLRSEAGKPQRKAALIASLLAGAAVLAATYFAADRFWLSKRQAGATMPVSSPAAADTGTGGRSVAVLPFDDLSESKDQAYFSDGLSEELIELLAKVPGLRVPARTSSFFFKGKQATLADIAKALNVSHVLEGSVRKAGRTLRITTQLVRVDTGSPMWSQTYDRKLDDIFKIQDEIAGSVVDALKLSLLGVPDARATPTANTEAYTAYLKCLAMNNVQDIESYKIALEQCQRAVDLDPGFTPAWSLLGTTLRNGFVAHGLGTYAGIRPKAYAAIQRALTLDPKYATAHVALGMLLYQMDFEPAAAELELKRALALDPRNSYAYWLEGYVASTQGRFDDALVALRRSQSLDPLMGDVSVQIGNVNYRAGRLAEAAEAYRTALVIRPKAGSVHYRLGLVALAQGNAQASLEEMEKETDPDFHAVGLPLALDALGRKPEADRILAMAEKTAAAGAAYQIALVYAARGDADRGFAWLDRAYAQRDSGMLWMKADPLLKSLRADPRFPVLLRKMHLE